MLEGLMNDIGFVGKATGTKVQGGGRVVIPAEFREQLGLQTGTDVVLDIFNGALRIRSMDQVISDVQAMVRKHVPEEVRLSDELIADRRLEADREEHG
jgi:AbrB family looped-hinge helix DNA binding protein